MTKTLVAHDGLFHVDDIFACAVIGLILDKQDQEYKIVRTRVSEVIEQADYVVDVGGVYDVSRNRFDHHQKEGAGSRSNGVPFASIGLVWKTYGQELCGSQEIATILDEKIIQAIDADDNAVETYKNTLIDVEVITIQKFFYTFRPTWKEDRDTFDKAFLELVVLAQKFILRKIRVETDKQEAEKEVIKAYERAEDKRIVVMEKQYPAKEFLITKTEPLYIVGPDATGTRWGVKTVEKNKDGFESRKDLPVAWGGLNNEDLQRVTGVPDAIFCHNALFLATAASKQGALELARLAVEY